MQKLQKLHNQSNTNKLSMILLKLSTGISLSGCILLMVAQRELEKLPWVSLYFGSAG